LNLKSIGSDSSTHFWTVGGAYETGPFGASVTYLNSKVDNGGTHNDFSNLSFGVDYKLAAGLTPYAEVNVVKLDPTGTANDNDATVVLVGTQLAF
jgi:predicted porin